MRLHRLEIEGFGPFRERQTVDFDAFADDGIFLIAGRTGAGKSSILDAVCFGLYGGVPRYDGGEKRLRSDHCAPEDISEVVVEFSTTAGRFRVARSPEYLRPAKRGGGMTKQAPTVSLERMTDAGWAGVAARAVDVANELEGILQLNQQQFLQVILLAQNRFARFLLADSRERQSLLRRLFGTERFEDVQARFDERRRASEERLGARTAVVAARVEEAEGVVSAEGLLAEGAGASMDAGGAADADASGGADAADGEGVAGGADPAGGADHSGGGADRVPARPAPSADQDASAQTMQERLDGLRRALARAQYRAERREAERAEAERAADTAAAALTLLREQRADQQERDRARAALAALDEAAPQIAAAREERSRAVAAEALRTVIAAADRAAGDLDEAERRRDTAAGVWREHGVDVTMAAEPLREWAAERTKQIGAWEQAARLEDEAPVRTGELAKARSLVAEAEKTEAETEKERAALPARIAESTAVRDTARREADRAEMLSTERDRAAARREAADEVVRLSAESDAAERAVVAAGEELTRAQAELTELRRRRLDGFAGELAAELGEGEPCPVCGSTAHPAPAVHADPVSAEDVERAEAARDQAARLERAAAEHAAALRAEVAAAKTGADGRDAVRAGEELAAAEKALAAAAGAVERTAELDETLVELHERAAVLEQERAAAASALAAAREALAVHEQRDADAVERIVEARGDFDTVAARIAAASEQTRAARVLADALGDAQRLTIAAEEARSERDAALAASDFADVETARAALRTASALDALQQRIDDHAAQREKERSRLLELELRTLPEDPIDTDPAERAAGEARAAWTGAMEAATRATTAVERLTGLIDSAEAEHDAVAEQTAQHEVLKNLADTIAGRGANTHKMTLETFVLAAELEEIVEAANRRLADMSTGRYRLQHSDALAARGAASGLGIVVYDAFTGQTRPAQSLSGGETFLSSLALALGLAEVVTSRAGGISLDTLFIDEGFGSLDADTLEIAMRTLDELRAGGRTVGVISHVEAMQEQIPAQLRVEQTDAGPSRIVA